MIAVSLRPAPVTALELKLTGTTDANAPYHFVARTVTVATSWSNHGHAPAVMSFPKAAFARAVPVFASISPSRLSPVVPISTLIGRFAAGGKLSIWKPWIWPAWVICVFAGSLPLPVATLSVPVAIAFCSCHVSAPALFGTLPAAAADPEYAKNGLCDTTQLTTFSSVDAGSAAMAESWRAIRT